MARKTGLREGAFDDAGVRPGALIAARVPAQASLLEEITGHDAGAGRCSGSPRVRTRRARLPSMSRCRGWRSSSLSARRRRRWCKPGRAGRRTGGSAKENQTLARMRRNKSHSPQVTRISQLIDLERLSRFGAGDWMSPVGRTLTSLAMAGGAHPPPASFVTGGQKTRARAIPEPPCLTAHTLTQTTGDDLGAERHGSGPCAVTGAGAPQYG